MKFTLEIWHLVLIYIFLSYVLFGIGIRIAKDINGRFSDFGEEFAGFLWVFSPITILVVPPSLIVYYIMSRFYRFLTGSKD